MELKTPNEWIDYQIRKGLAYLVRLEKLQENRLYLKHKMTLKDFEDIYCK